VRLGYTCEALPALSHPTTSQREQESTPIANVRSLPDNSPKYSTELSLLRRGSSSVRARSFYALPSVVLGHILCSMPLPGSPCNYYRTPGTRKLHALVVVFCQKQTINSQKRRIGEWGAGNGITYKLLVLSLEGEPRLEIELLGRSVVQGTGYYTDYLIWQTKRLVKFFRDTNHVIKGLP
jgi:hypothetical protein